MFKERYRSDAEFAGTGYADPEVDALIDQIEGEMVTYVRDGLIEQVWRKVLGDIVYVPLYRPINAWALRADLDVPISIMDGGRPEFRDARYTTPAGELGALRNAQPLPAAQAWIAVERALAAQRLRDRLAHHRAELETMAGEAGEHERASHRLDDEPLVLGDAVEAGPGRNRTR